MIRAADDPAGGAVLDLLFGDLIDAVAALAAAALVIGVCVLPFVLVRRLGQRRSVLIGLLAGGLLLTVVHLATSPLRYTWGLGWRRAVSDRVLVDRSLQQSGLAAYVKTTYDGPDQGAMITWLHPVTRFDRWVDQVLYERMIANAVPATESEDPLEALLSIIGLVTGVIGIIIKTLVWILAWTPLIKILSVVSVWPFLALAAGQSLVGGVAAVRFPSVSLAIATAALGIIIVVTAPDDTSGPPIEEPPPAPHLLAPPPPEAPPPPSPAPSTTACGDPDFDPGVEGWSDYTCRDAPADERGCLSRADYTGERGRGCPRLERCCPRRSDSM